MTHNPDAQERFDALLEAMLTKPEPTEESGLAERAEGDDSAEPDDNR